MLRENQEAPGLPPQGLEKSREANSQMLDTKRSARRQHLCGRLHAAGPRPVMEALLAVHAGQPLDGVLEDFGRIPAESITR